MRGADEKTEARRGQAERVKGRWRLKVGRFRAVPQAEGRRKAGAAGACGGRSGKPESGSEEVQLEDEGQKQKKEKSEVQAEAG